MQIYPYSPVQTHLKSLLPSLDRRDVASYSSSNDHQILLLSLGGIASSGSDGRRGDYRGKAEIFVLVCSLFITGTRDKAHDDCLKADLTVALGVNKLRSIVRFACVRAQMLSTIKRWARHRSCLRYQDPGSRALRQSPRVQVLQQMRYGGIKKSITWSPFIP